jgi:hypothetical protein
MLLLKEGTNPVFVDMYEWTPLHLASANGHTEVVNLLEKGASVQAQDTSGCTSRFFTSARKITWTLGLWVDTKNRYGSHFLRLQKMGMRGPLSVCLALTASVSALKAVSVRSTNQRSRAPGKDPSLSPAAHKGEGVYALQHLCPMGSSMEVIRQR